MVDYKKRLVEVEEILSYLSIEDYEKIPDEIIYMIEENKDSEYVWNYDETKSLREQNICKDTIAILSYINLKYLLNDAQKHGMEQILIQNEQEFREKYNIEDIFKSKQNDTKTMQIEKDTELVEYKEAKWYQKIFMKIINIFRR